MPGTICHYQKDYIIMPLEVNRFIYHQIGKRHHDVGMNFDYDYMVILYLMDDSARSHPWAGASRRVAAQCREYHYVTVDFGLKYDSCKSGRAWQRSAYLTIISFDFERDLIAVNLLNLIGVNLLIVVNFLNVEVQWLPQ
jgi:hypothetical protein